MRSATLAATLGNSKLRFHPATITCETFSLDPTPARTAKVVLAAPGHFRLFDRRTIEHALSLRRSDRAEADEALRQPRNRLVDHANARVLPECEQAIFAASGHHAKDHPPHLVTDRSAGGHMLALHLQRLRRGPVETSGSNALLFGGA